MTPWCFSQFSSFVYAWYLSGLDSALDSVAGRLLPGDVPVAECCLFGLCFLPTVYCFSVDFVGFVGGEPLGTVHHFVMATVMAAIGTVHFVLGYGLPSRQFRV